MVLAGLQFEKDGYQKLFKQVRGDIPWNILII